MYFASLWASELLSPNSHFTFWSPVCSYFLISLSPTSPRPPLLTLSLMRDRRLLPLLRLLLFLMRFVAPDLTFWLHSPRYFAFGLSQGWQFSNTHSHTHTHAWLCTHLKSVPGQYSNSYINVEKIHKEFQMLRFAAEAKVRHRAVGIVVVVVVLLLIRLKY